MATATPIDTSAAISRDQSQALNLLPDSTHVSWFPEIEEGNLHTSRGQTLYPDDIDIDWFWQNQSFIAEQELEINDSFGPSRSIAMIYTFPQERDENGNHPPPRYLQAAPSKVYVNHAIDVPAPNCGFPICNALTQDRRTELLMDLREIMDVDIRDPVFSLNSMKQGVHLWSREISTEYNFLHRELLLLREPGEITAAVVDTMGEPPGAQLVWSAISFGWAFMRSDDDREIRAAAKIQRAIRANVLSVSVGLQCANAI
jgi:hypothetical protein